MKALVLNCSLKSTPERSNTEALASVLVEEFVAAGVETEEIRLADLEVPPGVSTDLGGGDQWPLVHDRLLESEILVFATPTWLGHPSSLAQRALERMDAMIGETAANGLPVAYNRVAGVVVTGNEDGAHQVISHVAQGLIDIGYTVPGQAWTYWNRGPGPGPSYLESDEKHEWSETTGRTAAGVLLAVAQALQASPIPPKAYRA